MIYEKCGAYGREYSQCQPCFCTKGPSIPTWVCLSTGSQQHKGLEALQVLPHTDRPILPLTGTAHRDRDTVQHNGGALISVSLAASAIEASVMA